MAELTSDYGSALAFIEVFVAGWDAVEGVMIIRLEPEFDADVWVGIAAENERAFRDLLLKSLVAM